MKKTRIAFVAAVGALVALPLGATAQETPAPPSDAEAYAAQVQLGGEQVAAVGHSQAHAEQEAANGQAHAGALELGPEPPPAEQFGGTQEGPGESSGGLIETAGSGFDELGRIAVLPWSAAVSEDSTGRHSVATASLLHLALAPGGTKVIELRVMGSDSEAHHTDTLSTSSASSDGVVLTLGDPETDQFLRIVILHSEASSEAGASSYVVNIIEPGGEHQLITNDDDLGGGLAQICSAVNIPDLLQLVCVNASGGAANLLQAVLGDGAAQGGVADAINASISGGGAGTLSEVLGEVVEAPDAAAAAAETGAGALPATGMLSRLGIALAVFALAGAISMMRKQMTLSGTVA